MTRINLTKKRLIATVILATLSSTALSAPAAAQETYAVATGGQKTIVLSIGEGQQINLPVSISDVIVSNSDVAKVDVRSARQIYVFAKQVGETTVYATDASGKTVYKVLFRVGGNFSSINEMLGVAMPDANIRATVMNGTVLLTGTVAQPEDIEEAERLVEAYSTGSKVISRLKNATPLQVNLQVKIAEVARSLSKEISSNLQTRTSGGGTSFARGRDFVEDGTPATPNSPGTPATLTYTEGSNTLANLGRLFGIDFLSAFDLSERSGLISTLANPNLTTVSGETADFLVGGSFPIATSSNNGISVEYKKYGIALTYTPTVLSDGRISLRIKSEVSDISSQGAVRLNGFEIPATTTRLAETTVEMGSGESMMIGGLLKNELGSSVEKMPGAGDIPILGALFKSNGWRRNETELMIVVTPYLVKPISDSQIVLPTDGLQSPHDVERVLLNQTTTKIKQDNNRPAPKVSTDTAGPTFGSIDSSNTKLAQKNAPAKADSDAPGFSFE
jgi:pilus assembly protein CpaC